MASTRRRPSLPRSLFPFRPNTAFPAAHTARQRNSLKTLSLSEANGMLSHYRCFCYCHDHDQNYCFPVVTFGWCQHHHSGVYSYYHITIIATFAAHYGYVYKHYRYCRRVLWPRSARSTRRNTKKYSARKSANDGGLLELSFITYILCLFLLSRQDHILIIFNSDQRGKKVKKIHSR